MRAGGGGGGGGGAHDEDVILVLEPRLQGDNRSAPEVRVKLVGVGGVALGASIGPKVFDLDCENVCSGLYQPAELRLFLARVDEVLRVRKGAWAERVKTRRAQARRARAE